LTESSGRIVEGHAVLDLATHRLAIHLSYTDHGAAEFETSDFSGP